MYGGKDTLYEILGVNRSASAVEIERAYRTLRAAMEKEAADPRQAVLLREAHEVLADPQRREAYDASLRSSDFLRPKGKGPSGKLSKVRWAQIAAGAVVVVAAALYLLLRPASEQERIPQEIVAAASPAVGRLHLLDITGRATPLGHAFAIDAGVMVTTCHGLKPNAQLVVKFGARSASAQLSKSDLQRNICRLAVAGAGSWPLGIASATPGAGDKVYAALTNEAGETLITEGKVKGLLAVDGGNALELSFAVTPAASGGPILDTRGRVAGMMTSQHAFGAKHVALPAAWIQAQRSPGR